MTADRTPIDSTWLVESEEAGGAVAVIESRVPAGCEGPPLYQSASDEGFYVLDGELTFLYDDELVRAGRGGFVFAAAGVAHTLANPSGRSARCLHIRTPAGFQHTDVGRSIGERADLGPAKPAETVPGRVKVLLRGVDSDGRVALMDNAIPADAKGPPLHRHDFDEGFYVLAGELTFQLGDVVSTRGAGELVFVRRGAHHTFANHSGAEARVLIICTPAGFERYFQRIAAREAGVEPPPEALEPWPEVTVVGPRIGEAG